MQSFVRQTGGLPEASLRATAGSEAIPCMAVREMASGAERPRHDISFQNSGFCHIRQELEAFIRSVIASDRRKRSNPLHGCAGDGFGRGATSP